MKASVWILGDQLLQAHPALAQAEQQFSRQNVVILLLETRSQTRRLPYHAKKLTLLFSAMRHYAAELRTAGYLVDHRLVDDPIQGLAAHQREYEPVVMLTMEASSTRGRALQRNLPDVLNLNTTLVPNTQFLCGQFDPLPDVKPDQIVRQEQFYRKMRQHFGLLIDDQGQPIGGQWNFDLKNRQPLPKKLSVPDVLRFDPDPLTQQVISEVNQSDFTSGSTAGFDLAVTREQAQLAVTDFLDHRLDNFGTYEDGMRHDETVLFHSKLALYLNIGLLEPLDLVRAAEARFAAGQAAINNIEGFIRQVIGWREYMYWQYQRLMPGLAQGNHWGAVNPLPSFFWQPAETEMNCLRTVIERVLTTGYTHHIERLMVLSNFCLMASIHPDEVYRWFSCVFIDAYEWVMVPNVYGMGLSADGGRIASKPYIASANYINRMSDYCQSCAFDKKQRTGKNACPFNFLYWHFLLTHREELAQNNRMLRMLHNLKYLAEDEQRAVQDQAHTFLARF